MRKIIIILVSITITISLILGIFENQKGLEKFIDNKNIIEIKVIDSLNNIVDGEEIRKKLSEGEYVQANDLLKKGSLSLVYSEEIIKSEDYDTYTDIETEFITSHYKYDKLNKYPQKWRTIIKVSYRENPDQTMALNESPSITVETNWGGEINSYSIDYKYIDSDKIVEFYGSYELKSRTVIPIGIIKIHSPIGFKYDYGTIYLNHIVGNED